MEILSIVNKILKEAESTIPKETSEKVFKILNLRFHVVHATHR
jgi:hypothetical protein